MFWLPTNQQTVQWHWKYDLLTHWGRVTHLCISKLTIIGSDNGLSPGRCQAIIWTNAGILLIEPLGTNFSEILIETHTFSFKKMRLKISTGKRRPFCLGLNVLIASGLQLEIKHRGVWRLQKLRLIQDSYEMWGYNIVLYFPRWHFETSWSEMVMSKQHPGVWNLATETAGSLTKNI